MLRTHRSCGSLLEYLLLLMVVLPGKHRRLADHILIDETLQTLRESVQVDVNVLHCKTHAGLDVSTFLEMHGGYVVAAQVGVAAGNVEQQGRNPNVITAIGGCVLREVLQRLSVVH
jgi:hypothetical protein